MSGRVIARGVVAATAAMTAVSPLPSGPAVSHAAPVASVTCGLGSFRAGHWPTACWRPYADSSPFNRPLPAEPRTAAGSEAIIDRVLSSGPVAGPVAGVADTTSDWYHPLYWSQPDDPLYTVHCAESWGRCAVEDMPVRIPAAARAAGGSDGHLAVLDQSSGWEYDFWQVREKPGDGGVLTVSWGGRTPIAGDGLRGGATASNYGLAAGVIRAAELEAGRIDHALAIVVDCTSDGYVYPADKTAQVCADPADAPANGQLLWLDMSSAEIEELPVADWKKTILRAMSTYGAYVEDTGDNVGIAFQIESGSSFTSFGVPDPMVDFARRQTEDVTREGRTWVFDMASDVDWPGRLRVLDPCVAAGNCSSSCGR